MRSRARRSSLGIRCQGRGAPSKGRGGAGRGGGADDATGGGGGGKEESRPLTGWPARGRRRQVGRETGGRPASPPCSACAGHGAQRERAGAGQWVRGLGRRRRQRGGGGGGVGFRRGAVRHVCGRRDGQRVHPGPAVPPGAQRPRGSAVGLHRQPGAGRPALPVLHPLHRGHVGGAGLVLRRAGLPGAAQPRPPHHARQHLHPDRHVHRALPGRRPAAGDPAPGAALPQSHGRRRLGGLAAPHPAHDADGHPEPQRRREAHLRPDLEPGRLPALPDGALQHQHPGPRADHRLPLRPLGHHLPGVAAEPAAQEGAPAIPAPESAHPGLHHRPGVLGLLPALLDLAAGAPLPRAPRPPAPHPEVHQLPGHLPDLQQQLHQPLPLHLAHQELPGVPAHQAQHLLPLHLLLPQKGQQLALLVEAIHLLQHPVRVRIRGPEHDHAEGLQMTCLLPPSLLGAASKYLLDPGGHGQGPLCQSISAIYYVKTGSPMPWSGLQVKEMVMA